jgi:lysophospholipase L1-like esterase
MKFVICIALAALCLAHPACGEVTLTSNPNLRGLVQQFLDERQLTPDQKKQMEAALSGVAQEPEIASAVSELTTLRLKIQEGRKTDSGEVDMAVREEYRRLQRETAPKVRAALLVADPSLSELLGEGEAVREVAEVPAAAAEPAAPSGPVAENSSGNSGVNMSAVRSITQILWSEGNLTPEEKAQVDAALAKVLQPPEMIASMEALAQARKAHQGERAKFPADRDNAVTDRYRRVQKEATDKLRAALLSMDPDLAKIMTGSNEGEDKTDSESGNKKALAPVSDAAGLPRVLLIGDSISIGYTLQVREKLQGKANVHRIPMNGGATEVGLAKIDDWLGEGKWDVIHFNFGLHDAKYASATEQRASRDEYVANLQKLIDRMRATGAKLIFATTTPIPEKLEYGKAEGTRMFDGIPERNVLAVDLMNKNGVAVNDLYSLVLPVRETACRPGDVHFTPEGYELLAGAVAASVEQQLPAKSGL